MFRTLGAYTFPTTSGFFERAECEGNTRPCGVTLGPQKPTAELGLCSLGSLQAKTEILPPWPPPPGRLLALKVPLLPLVQREYISGSYAALPVVQLRSAGSQEVSFATIVSTI